METGAATDQNQHELADVPSDDQRVSASSSKRPKHQSSLIRGEQAGHNTTNDKDLLNKDVDPWEYQLRKHMPHRLPRRYNDVYITIKTKFEAQLKRCMRLLDDPKTNEIFLHGIGLGVNRAVNLALRLEHHYYPAVQNDTKTETVRVTDELMPLRDDLDPMMRTRDLSAVHVRLFFCMPKEPIVPKQAAHNAPPHHIVKEKQENLKQGKLNEQLPKSVGKTSQLIAHAGTRASVTASQATQQLKEGKHQAGADSGSSGANSLLPQQQPSKERRKHLPPGVSADPSYGVKKPK